MRFRRLIVSFAALLATIMLAGLAAAWLVPLPKRLAIPGSRVIEYADGTPMCAFLSPDDKWRIPVELERVDPDYLEALISYEDKRFYQHPGVDPLAVTRAAFQNIAARGIVSGASTITMQLVRILEPRPRTFRSKFIEALRAVQLELRLDKREILAYYLQFLPYGSNLEGIESASLAYFGHWAGELSPLEIACLIAVPQNPSQRYPCPENAPRLSRAIKRVSERLVKSGVFDAHQQATMYGLDMPSELLPFPREALHAAQYIAARFPGARVRSTMRRDVQAVCEHTLMNYERQYRSMGIHNASVVVIDNRGGEVAAAVGNFDFWDREHQGQVKGFIAPRSPGSAMKPFIYALAIDRGLALPGYLVPDIPVHYSGYSPINYDRRFRGLVRLKDALSQSLNIPFVNLLNDVGLTEYLEFLQKAGITTLQHEPGYYGLSIAVGGLEVCLVELTNLYAMLGRDGKYQDLKWTLDQKPRPARQLLCPGAAFLTRQALRIRDRPDFPRRGDNVALPAQVFWKTGTSARHRDAWALGGTLAYTAGVWVGNFEGTSSRYLVGADRSGPVLFDVLEGLSGKHRADAADRPPPDLIEVEVCAWSGRLAGPHCPHRKEVYAPSSCLPRQRCPYHVEYWIDEATGYRLNPLCIKGREAASRVFTVLPASVRRWISDQRLAAPEPPPWLPSCPHLSLGDEGPRIVSPRAGAIFFVVPGIKAKSQEIPLEAEAGVDVGELFWFVDGRFLTSGPPTKRVWLEPEPGPHEISVQDAAGRSHTIKIKVVTAG